MSSESSLTTFLIALAGAIAGGSGWVWNWYQDRQQKKGFMKLTLTSQYFIDLKKVVSKTSVENTSKKPIEIGQAIVFTINETKTNRQKVMEELKTRINKDEIFRTDVLFHLYKLQDILKEDEIAIRENNYSVEWLSYYNKDNERLGPLEILATTYSHEILPSGNYSIYFCVFGKDFIEKRNPALFRVVQDKAFVIE